MYIKWHGTMLINPIKSGAPQKSWCSWLAPLEIYKKKAFCDDQPENKIV